MEYIGYSKSGRCPKCNEGRELKRERSWDKFWRNYKWVIECDNCKDRSENDSLVDLLDMR